MNKMSSVNVLHILASGGIGGIEILCKDYATYSKNNNIFLFLWNGGIIADEMKNKGDNVIILNAKKKEVIKTLNRILKICRTYEIKSVVVHHASPISHIYLMIIKKLLPNITTIAYAHGNAEDMCGSLDERARFIRKLIMSKSLNSADKVIAISNSVKNSLISYFKINEKKIIVLYNGVDVKNFYLKRKKENRENKVLELIYVGRLIQEKGVQTIIKALSLLPSDFKYRFRIIGDGPYREILEKLVMNYGLMNRIQFLGKQKNVVEYLWKSDIFIHMPIWKEGFGITIVEAMAAGLICICARQGAIPEIITDKENGFLVEKNNYINLKKVILDIVNKYSYEDLEKIRKNAVKKSKAFSIEKFSNTLDQIMHIRKV